MTKLVSKRLAQVRCAKCGSYYVSLGSGYECDECHSTEVRFEPFASESYIYESDEPILGTEWYEEELDECGKDLDDQLIITDALVNEIRRLKKELKEKENV